ncbi:hypothetical protein [Tahibacter amnicola]|uniref:Uncharacterized protein n=1 Tax=Tahibacter amnicola TaxID=2976241 RepID=A0ABY6BD12_9GAMM|nr:hypothetical protein [Tahibacter amnicola]UXI67010.1 hypothetical protein N4264_19985 [Tahibacter amnicola]
MKIASCAAACAALLSLPASAVAGVALPLVIADEDHVVATDWSYTDGVATFSTQGPAICAKVDDVAQAGAQKLDVQWPGVGPRGGSFRFGPLDGQGRQIPVAGLRSLEFVPEFRVIGDDGLVCYGLRSDSTRRHTAYLLVAPFEETPDATVTATVVALPDAANGFTYTYFVDLDIPPMSPMATLPYVISAGYDGSVFDSARYCKVAPAATSCGSAPTVNGNLYERMSVAPFHQVHVRYIVTLTAGQVIDASIAPSSMLAMAGLFTYMGAEVRLDNNIAVGRAAVGNGALAAQSTAHRQ